MNLLSSKNSLASSAEHTSEYALTKWLNALIDFHSYHRQLVSCIDQTTIERDWNTENRTVYIGQCPIVQLMKLVNMMNKELKKLDSDVDQINIPRQSSTGKHYKKLVAHTRVLTGLNQQAQYWLHLISLRDSNLN